MKIEKINENQIRCTLTSEDLNDRNIKISELAYGSEKANNLFKDMIKEADNQFGFEINDLPVMVEAIPTSKESIILLITKVEYPEELDTRFSRFSTPKDMPVDDEDFGEEKEASKGATDILDLFNKIKQEQEKISKSSSEAESQTESGEKTKKKSNRELLEEKLANLNLDMTKMFEFESLDQVIKLSRALGGFYKGDNDLYKSVNNDNSFYYLLVHKSDHTPKEYNKICNIISEYANQRSYTKAVGAHMEEHERLIVADNALQTLMSI